MYMFRTVVALLGMLSMSFLPGCGDSAEDQTVASLPAPGGKKSFQMRLNLPNGYSARVREVVNGESTNKTKEETFKQRQNTEDVYLLECVGLAPNGVMTIKKTFLTSKIKMQSGKDDGFRTMLEFDSSKENQKGVFSGYFSPRIGEAVLIKVVSDGTIIAAEGTEELAEKIIKAEEATGANHSPEKREDLKKGLCKNLQRLPGILVYYPSDPVSVGDSWQGPWSNCGGAICPRFTWKLESIEGGLAYIEVQGNNVPISYTKEQEGLEMQSNITQNNRISISLDVKTGMMTSCEGETETSGTLVAIPGKGAGPSQESIRETELSSHSTFQITAEQVAHR